MGKTNNYKLKIRQISVYTNLEVQLNARTTKEEANKEVDRMMASDNLFEGYDWKIEGCCESKINNFSPYSNSNCLEDGDCSKSW